MVFEEVRDDRKASLYIKRSSGRCSGVISTQRLYSRCHPLYTSRPRICRWIICHHALASCSGIMSHLAGLVHHHDLSSRMSTIRLVRVTQVFPSLSDNITSTLLLLLSSTPNHQISTRDLNSELGSNLELRRCKYSSASGFTNSKLAGRSLTSRKRRYRGKGSMEIFDGPFPPLLETWRCPALGYHIRCARLIFDSIYI